MAFLMLINNLSFPASYLYLNKYFNTISFKKGVLWVKKKNLKNFSVKEQTNQKLAEMFP